jgi:hypothetical protein
MRPHRSRHKKPVHRSKPNLPELELFTGDEQRSGPPPPVRSGPVRSGITAPPTPDPRPLPPRSLRQTGLIVTGRVSAEDASWIRAAGGAGRILRSFVRHYRGDLEVLQLRDRQRNAELELSVSNSFREITDEQLDRRAQRRQDLQLLQKAIDQLRPDFAKYSSQVKTWDHQIIWVRSRIQRIRELRNLDPRDVLDELLAKSAAE